MSLPYYLGCPAWSSADWVGSLYPSGTAASGFLAHYSYVFNTVEGNTTFYAWPSEATVARWAAEMPADFRFCAKLPRDISHAADLREQEDQVRAFLTRLAPLGKRLTPLWLQLPAAFGPARLGELATLLDWIDVPLAVEVRHPAFFARGDEERVLNRLLRDRHVERICLDTRGLFSCRSQDAAVLHAQSWKPRLPVRPAAFSDSPQLRFVGHPQWAANEPFLRPWVEKIASWIEEGRTPHVYLHTPDNRLAPEFARQFHERLSERLPGLPPLRFPAASAEPQLPLLGEAEQTR